MAPNLSTLRGLSAGDVILEAKPIVHSLYASFKGKHCDNCLIGSDSLQKCSKCHQMYYCGRECQKTDWKIHQKECEYYGTINWTINPMTGNGLLLLRLWFCLKSDASFGTKKYKSVYGSEVCFNDIEVDLKKLKESVRKNLANELNAIVANFKFEVSSEDKTKLLRLLATIKSPLRQSLKWYPIDSSGMNFAGNVGHGLYPQLSSVGHSCLPNSAVVMNGLTLQLRAMTSIPSGSAITRSYIDLAHNKTERQALLTYYGIDCHCDKCVNNLDANVDYKKVKELIQLGKFEEYFFRPKEQRNEGNGENLPKRPKPDEMVAMCRQIFPEHYPQMCEYFCNWMGRTTRGFEAMAHLLPTVKRHIAVTHGFRHPIYKLFLNLKAMTELVEEMKDPEMIPKSADLSFTTLFNDGI